MFLWKIDTKSVLVYNWFFLAVLGVHCYMQAFSSCGELRLLSRRDAQASHSGDFSC